MLDCKHASHLLSQSMDRKLTLGERVGLWVHLLMCEACTQFARQMALLRQAVRQWTALVEHDASIRLPDEARYRIRQSLRHPGNPFNIQGETK